MKLYIGMRLRPLMFLLFREKQHESNSLFLVVLGNVNQLHLMVTSIYGFLFPLNSRMLSCVEYSLSYAG